MWDGWRVEHEAASNEVRIQETVANTEGRSSAPALSAARAVQRRLLREYLLRDLSQRCFLPVHGFPTGIAQLVTSNIESERRGAEPEEGTEREIENFRAFPSRELPMAIREYAAGTTVTLDGKVYRPKGVTLNWHLPASEAQARETQEFKHVWKCPECGAGGVRALKPEACLACGHAPMKTTRFLQPAGFAVDFFDDVSNDESDRLYVPVRPPQALGRGPWVDLVAPELGRLRVTDEGRVVHLNHGSLGHGYAICLSCGRTAAESSAEATQEAHGLPAEMRDHRRLRGGSAKTAIGTCSGNDQPFLIKRHQGLGAVVQTSLFELALLPGEPSAPRKEGLRAIAIALRQAAAEHLGIETREMGWAVRAADADSRGPTIALFDTAAGGAGYVTQLPNSIRSLLTRAAAILKCVRECDRACHACLLSFDTQHDIDKVDRHAGLLILTEDFLRRLAPGPELESLLGPGSTFEARPLREALESTISRGGTKEIRIGLGGPIEEWDLPNWSLREDVLSWTGDGILVRLVVDASDFAKLDAATRENLRALMQAARVDVVSAPPVGSGSTRRPTVELERAGECYLFAMSDAARSAPSPYWGLDSRVMRLRRSGDLEPVVGRALTVAELAPQTVENVTVIARPRFGLDVGSAATVLLDTILKIAPEAKARIASGAAIVSIAYDDRYLQSAVAFRLALELARAIAGSQRPRTIFRAADKSAFAATGFRTGDKDVPSRLLASAGTDALRSVLGNDSAMHVVDKAVLPHHRSLVVTWSDNKRWRVDFDGGIGLDVRSPANLMRLDALSQADLARRLATAAFVVTAEPGRPQPPIYVWKMT